MRPDATIATCRASHQRLLRAVIALSDDQLHAPSRLPRFTRGHVVAHVVNKTYAHVWVFGGPDADEVRRLFPDGYDAGAAADIGASRSATELGAELANSLARLEQAWDALDDAHWDRQAIMTAGPRSMMEVVSHHLRNVEVHHVDLDVGYEISDWPSDFVEPELVKRCRGLSDRADHSELLAWLLDRAPAPDLGPW